MSKSVGNRLPERLLAALAAGRSGKVLVAATLDDEGWPHASLLAAASVEPTGERTLRVALAKASRTAANLARDGRLTLVFVDPDMVYYLKVRAASGATNEDGGMVSFEALVEDVLADTPAPHEAGSVISTGITFRHAAPGQAG